MHNRDSLNDAFLDISSKQPYWYKTWYNTEWNCAYGDNEIEIVNSNGKSFLYSAQNSTCEEVLLCKGCHRNYHLKKVSDNTQVIQEGSHFYALETSSNRKIRVYTREEAEDFRELVDAEGNKLSIHYPDSIYTKEYGYLLKKKKGLSQVVLSRAEYNEEDVKDDNEQNAEPSRKRPHEDCVGDQEDTQARKKPALDNGRFFAPTISLRETVQQSAFSQGEQRSNKAPDTWY